VLAIASLLLAAGALVALIATGALGDAGSAALGAAEAEALPAPPPLDEPLLAVEAAIALEPSLPESGPATITVAAVGDMIFDRRVRDLIAREGGAAPLSEVAAQLAAADAAIGNLESPLSSGGSHDGDKDYTFRGDPRGIAALELAGFDAVSLGNNHALDWGAEALADTVALLDESGIGHAGAGADKAAAVAPAVIDVDGTTVAFLSYSHILPPGFIATDSRAGIARGRGNMDEVEAAVRAAAETYDYVLVSYHWGDERESMANADQVADAHRTVDAGADMVLSHHPHVIQGAETYEGGLILYSSGDFVFDHYSRETGEAFIMDATLGPHGVTDVRFTPVYLDGEGKPEYVSGSAAMSILERLRRVSSPHGTTIVIEGDVGRVVE
jgi:poly-gamma-glutamate synthesis protein (capsule biosynthesis protein)